MDKVFFAKMNNVNEINNKSFTVSSNSWFNGIDIGDFAFIRPEGKGITELWRAIRWELNGSNKTLKFEQVYQLDSEINISNQFTSLKLFKLDINILNKIIKTTKGICFFELQLMPNALNIIKDKTKFHQYIENQENYRAISICNSFNEIKPDSEDIQLYIENNSYHLFPASFLDKSTIVDKFNKDNFYKGKQAGQAKGKLYNIINIGNKFITRHDASLVGFYDLFISNNDTSKNKRIDFISWCQNNNLANSSSQYENGLRAIESNYNVDLDEEFEKDKCHSLLNIIKNDEVVLKSKRELKGNQRNWDSFLNKFIEYKLNVYSKQSTTNVKSENISVDENNEELKKVLSLNTIFYGVPGCGKSHKINEILHIGNKFKEIGNALNEKYYKRILFHPEYTHSDFVGQIMPVTIGDKIEYRFQPGPFVEILRDALKNETKNYFLIIEEINRGNAPAIFGDIFQLLDRDEHGQSEYEVYNKEILHWLKSNDIQIQQVYIPKNLTILATMNTSDQNVFTLDTAFKRRWEMCRIKNDFSKNNHDEFLDKKIAGNKYTWREFAQALNEDIISNCNDGAIAEDKLLGTHFIKGHQLNNLQAFAEKIFMYLWNDVVKYNKEQLFRPDIKTLDSLIDKFVNGENVFNHCNNLDKLYEKYSNESSETLSNTENGNLDE